jgi:hypothetical protein
VLHLHGHPRLARADAVECDDARVAVAVDRLPRDALVGALLGDLGGPGVLLGARTCHPAEMRRVDLVDGLHALHEPGELLELRPLVVSRSHGHLDVDGLGDAGHVSPPLGLRP